MPTSRENRASMATRTVATWFVVAATGCHGPQENHSRRVATAAYALPGRTAIHWLRFTLTRATFSAVMAACPYVFVSSAVRSWPLPRAFGLHSLVVPAAPAMPEAAVKPATMSALEAQVETQVVTHRAAARAEPLDLALRAARAE